MQIPWYIGWPIVIAFSVGILLIVARRSLLPDQVSKRILAAAEQTSAEDVWLLTSDGVRLHAWWVMASQASLVTLYLHGNAGNATHRFLQIRAAADEDHRPFVQDRNQ